MDNNKELLPEFDPYTEPSPRQNLPQIPPQQLPPQVVDGQVQQNLPYGAQSPYAYGTPYKYYPTGLATASLVLGIVSIFAGIPILSIVGIILGIIFKTKHYPVGRAASTGGIIFSIIGLVVFIVSTILMFAYMNEIFDLIEQAYPEMYEQVYAPLEEILREIGIME
ncbi:MAG: DUF4190 domain-containing protein [Ruminococcus sp.]|jgi:uncharacterized membrane protein|nr:DUF4190 domain-containing protein [Ruminococcus sp.]